MSFKWSNVLDLVLYCISSPHREELLNTCCTALFTSWFESYNLHLASDAGYRVCNGSGLTVPSKAPLDQHVQYVSVAKALNPKLLPVDPAITVSACVNG